MWDEDPEIESWLDGLDDKQREQVEWLAGRVVSAVPDADAAIKWKRLTFTEDADFHHWLCAVAPSSRAVRLVFHKGALLDDPEDLLEGEGRYTRDVPYAAAAQHPDAIAALLEQAADRRTEMLDENG